jgi:DNA (cytosine-5)-methyltransferase 1
MRFGSVCSGIEAASVAWHLLGWQAAWLAEIEPFPSAVLKHHYPEVPNLGDMTTLPDRIRSGEVEAPDLFCGGTPCQAFSVAGLRRSLDDARGNLSLTFCEIANAIDDVRFAGGKPASIIFWENVPGVLSTADNAFGCFLGALAGCDSPVFSGGRWTDAGVVAGPQRTVAWRILDAQFFGLAQRRRRVFVVASARDGFDPAAVLFEWEGLRRDSAPSREAGQRVANALTDRADRGGTNSEGQRLISSGVDFQNCASTGDLSACLLGEALKKGGQAGIGVLDVSMCLNAKGGAGRLDAESETLIPTIGGGFDGPVAMRESGQGYWMQDDIAGTLRAEGEDRPSRPSHVIGTPVTYDFFNITAPVNRQSRKPGDPCHTLARSNAEHAVVMQPVAFHPTQDPINSTDISHAIGTGSGRGCATAAVAWAIGSHAGAAEGEQTNRSHASGGPVGSNISEECAYSLRGGRTQGVATAMQVRRLTPVECERLQGFPDGYTAIPWRGKPASECPDGPRYKALGNSWAVPVVRWIGRRINRFLEETP